MDPDIIELEKLQKDFGRLPFPPYNNYKVKICDESLKCVIVKSLDLIEKVTDKYIFYTDYEDYDGDEFNKILKHNFNIIDKFKHLFKGFSVGIFSWKGNFTTYIINEKDEVDFIEIFLRSRNINIVIPNCHFEIIFPIDYSINDAILDTIGIIHNIRFFDNFKYIRIDASDGVYQIENIILDSIIETKTEYKKREKNIIKKYNEEYKKKLLDFLNNNLVYLMNDDNLYTYEIDIKFNLFKK